jgi:hypothetical protein
VFNPRYAVPAAAPLAAAAALGVWSLWERLAPARKDDVLGTEGHAG